jgi:molecular chaperone DnaK
MKRDLWRADLRSKQRTILVCDLGGGKFEVTVVRYTQATIDVVASEADVTLGGPNWTQRIVDSVCEQFKRIAEDPREDPGELRVAFQACEAAKRQLSTGSKVPIQVQHRERTLTVSMTRDDFERITADLLQRTADATVRVLQQAKVDPGDVDDVIIVGGATAMPAVGKMLQQLCSRQQSPAPLPDEAVAQGAAIHAANLERNWRGRPHFPGDYFDRRQ